MQHRFGTGRRGRGRGCLCQQLGAAEPGRPYLPSLCFVAVVVTTHSAWLLELADN